MHAASWCALTVVPSPSHTLFLPPSLTPLAAVTLPPPDQSIQGFESSGPEALKRTWSDFECGPDDEICRWVGLLL